MDVFDFTAKETAHMIASTEGAVQVALSRARMRLRDMADMARGEEPKVRPAGAAPDPVWFEAILNGFRKRNPKAIYEAYLRLHEGGVRLRGLRSMGGRLFFTFQDPDGNLLMVST
jgi:RNA polymerase sigma-70 factor (ECF subfamily)